MASYDLTIFCAHRTDTLSVNPTMSVNDIIQYITSSFNLNANSFNIQIYDEQIRAYVDFDDEYDKELRKRLPKNYKCTFVIQISSLEASDTEEEFDVLNDLLFPSNVSVKSPVGISITDELVHDVTSDDIDSRLLNSSNSAKNECFDSNDNSSTVDHIVFVRDVVPYETGQYLSNILHEDEAEEPTNITHIRRIQGIKDFIDGRYACILPEIKIPQQFIQQDRFKLAVAIVLEESREDQVILRLHEKKGFLPDGTGIDTVAFNPLHLEIERSAKTNNGSFKLPLRICNSLRNTFVKRSDAVFHTLQSTAIRRLHLAEHVSGVPRLACVLIDTDGTVLWKTLGFSNFIQPIVSGKRKAETQNSDNCESDDKRKNVHGVLENVVVSTRPIPRVLAVQSDYADAKQCIVQNFLIVWLDSAIDEPNNDLLNSFIKLQGFVNILHMFTDADKCVNFLTDIRDEKVLMVISGSLSQQIISLIYDIPQLDSIYIFCENKLAHEKWVNGRFKVKGVFTEIAPICKSLEKATRQCDENSIPFSLIFGTDILKRGLNQLEPSFMYSLLLKEILLTIDFNEEHIIEFVTYFREKFSGNHSVLDNIDKFEKHYKQDSSIWWYTSSPFLYSMLNRALRTLETDIIIKMGFFIRDLYCQISRLHLQQTTNNRMNPLTVYRGQALSKDELVKIRETSGGLISFNSFLSTSLDRNVSLLFAETASENPDLVGVLFQITIDASLKPAPFASLDDMSFYGLEQEVLFSMHSVFRIGRIEKQQDNELIWDVELILTNDDDPELRILTEYLRKETFSEQKGWYQLGSLLNRLGEFDKSEKIYMVLLEQTSDDAEKISLYHQLVVAKDAQAQYIEAIAFHEKALQIARVALPPNHAWFATFYNDIARVYFNMGDYSTALIYYEKVLEILERSSTPNYLDFATYYVNTGLVYRNIGDYSKALLSYKKALDIQEQSLPPNHPDLASSYDNMGNVLRNLAKYPEAISFYSKALQIRQQSLPSSHPDFASSYNNGGCAYYKMGEYSKALSYYEKALKIRQKNLLPNHSNLGSLYNNIGKTYDDMGEYSTSLSWFEKALQIQQTALPPNHPDLASSYHSIGNTYENLGEYSKALSYYEKGIEIFQKTFPSNHPYLASSYNNIGNIWCNMGEYSKALSFYEKALEIQRNTLPSNHPDLASSYNNIGNTYNSTREYSKALSYYEKGTEIFQQTLPPDHPHLASSYNNVGGLHYKMGDYSKALSYYEKALEIFEKALPANHLSFATSYANIGAVYDKRGEYSKALSYYEKDLEMSQKTLPANHSNLGTSYNNIGMVYFNMGDYSKALLYYEKALEIRKQSLSSNHTDFGMSYNNIGMVYDEMGDYPKAISYYEKALEISKQSLPSNHLGLGASYNNISNVYCKMGDYPKALSYYERDLEISKQSLPSNHPDLGASYNNIGNVYYSMGDYPKALSSHEKALEISKQSLPSDHPHLGASYNNIGAVYFNMGDYPRAISYYEKALEVSKQSLSLNHPDFGDSYNNIGMVYYSMGDYPKAFSFYERAVEIGQHSLPAIHPHLQLYKKNLDNVKKKM